MLRTREDPTAELRGREREENFPVALRILPRRHREDLHAVYAFARTVDELGDGGGGSPGDRTGDLLAYDAELDRVWSDRPLTDPVLARLRPTVRAHGLPPEPFHHLVRANLADQRVDRYETYADLLGYCRLSADPVGRIVLGVFGVTDPALVEQSDRICTALQLLEHCQDLAEDRRAGRVYFPREDFAAYGVDEADLDRAAATPALRALMRFQVDRAAALLAGGRAIVSGLHGWARVCVAGFVAGGEATVAALRRTDGDVLARDAHPSRAGTAARMLALLAGSAKGGVR